jgi:hypothetical protein
MEFVPSGDLPRAMVLGWRTWVRAGWHSAFFVLCAILAAIADMPWWLRLAAAAFAVAGVVSLIDLLGFTRRWSIDASGVHVPSVLRRTRRIDLSSGGEVTLLLGRVRALRSAGTRPGGGDQIVSINALVSGRDVRVWFDANAETIRPVDEVKERRRALAGHKRRR